MNLRDRRRRHGHIVKAPEYVGKRSASLMRNLAARQIGVKGGKTVLKKAQRMRHMRPYKIGPGRQGLAKFDEARAKSDQGFCQRAAGIKARPA